ncbi:Type 1 glutamine amidotransferase-like domain-containing protein, partial [uncultured Winogradskyella sp.]|uniref:Type 1 glutamine amidotransferase-like domain-containing protein n=1 Tax=uncultured Winogradskyella sp. TaxID=395353 RepID=UPI002608D336
MKSLLIASTSTVHGSGYLDYLLDALRSHFKSANEILFIPYARPGGMSYDDYTKIASKAFNKIGKTIKGI